MASKKELATAYILARDKLARETGHRLFQHKQIIAMIEQLTGTKAGKDLYGYLLAYGRNAAPAQSKRHARTYGLDQAMRIAQARASVQPELISMNSNIKYWSNDD